MRGRQVDGPDAARQRVDDQALVIDRNAEHAKPQRPEQLPRRAIARIFDGDRLAWLEQDARQQIECLLGAVRDDEVFGRGRDAS